MREKKGKGKSSATEFGRQLAAYSVAAGAMLTMGAQAEAAVQSFHPPTPLRVDKYNSPMIDMDMDGNPDFSMQYSMWWSTYTCQFFKIDINRLNSMNLFDGSNHSARNLDLGATDNPTLDVDDAVLMSFRMWHGASAWLEGQFNRAASGYIGVKFRGAGGKDYNGWIHFTGSKAPFSNPFYGTVDAWAYEDSGGPIVAGDQGSGVPFAMTYLSDMNGNGESEVGVLRKPQSESVAGSSVIIKDTFTKQTINSFGCLDPSFRPVGVRAINNASGKSYRTAVLGVSGDSLSDRVVRVQIVKTASGSPVTDIFFDNRFEPVSLIMLKDMNGNGYQEIAVLGENPVTGEGRVEIRDSFSGALIRAIIVDSSTNDSVVSFSDLPDINGNGAFEFMVLLYTNAPHRSSVRIFDSSTGAPIKTIECLKYAHRPVDLKRMADISGNGKPEVAVVGMRLADKNVRVEIIDTKTGAMVKAIPFNNAYIPVALSTVDMNRDAVPEISLLQMNRRTGKVQIAIRNPLTGAIIKTIPFP